MPVISIGMPVFNGEKYLDDAILSLLAQSFTDFELIISDNASTDQTSNICALYTERDPRIHYLRQKTNIGSWNNYKCVLDNACGDYFMWAAADDMWSVNWLEVLLREINEGDVSVYGSVCFLKESELSRVDLKSFGRGEYFHYFMNWESKAMYIYGLFRRSMLKQLVDSHQGLPEVGLDHALLMSALRRGGLRSVSGPYQVYRFHNDQEHIKIQEGANGVRNYIAYKYGYYMGIVRSVPGAYKLMIIALTPIHLVLSSALLVKLKNLVLAKLFHMYSK